MSTDRETTRVVRSWLDEGVTTLPDRVLDAVLDRVPATPQRRSWWPARRSYSMNLYVKLAVAAAAVLAVAFAGLQLLPGGSFGGRPTPTPVPSPSAAPTAGPTAIPYSLAPTTGLLDPGAYVLDGPFPLSIAFDVPAGWSREDAAEGADLVGIHKVRDGTSPAYASWAIIANVYEDPCHPASGPADPPVGPTVDDLVAALTGMAGFEATTPSEITVDGYNGQQFTLSTDIDPAEAGCDDSVWLSLWEPASDGGTARVPGALTMQFWVLDVDGTRLVMFTEEYGDEPTDFSEAVDILESSRFEP